MKEKNHSKLTGMLWGLHEVLNVNSWYRALYPASLDTSVSLWENLGFLTPIWEAFPRPLYYISSLQCFRCSRTRWWGCNGGRGGRRWHKATLKTWRHTSGDLLVSLEPPQSDTKSSEPQVLHLGPSFPLCALGVVLSSGLRALALFQKTLQTVYLFPPLTSPGRRDQAPTAAPLLWVADDHPLLSSLGGTQSDNERQTLCPLSAPPHLIPKKNNTKPQINYKE